MMSSTKFVSLFLLILTVASERLFAENHGADPVQEKDDTMQQLVRRKNEHPLMPIIRWAEKERPRIADIKDYTALLTKRESIEGVLQEPQVMEIKVRHEPFSVYVKSRFPARLNGQEAIFIQGRNDGKVIAHGAGVERTLGTQRITPEGVIAMRGNKYPITDLGLLNLIDKLLEVGRRDTKFGECDVKYYENVKVGERKCILLEITHPVPRKNFVFHIARIFVDAELKLPIRYDSHDWPPEGEEKPILIEEYTYENLKLNTGLTDRDFDYRNPDYGYTINDRHGEISTETQKK